MSELFKTNDEKSPIMVNVNEFKDKKYLDIRKYYVPEGETEFKPTQKGITLSKVQFESIFQYLKENYDKIMENL